LIAIIKYGSGNVGAIANIYRQLKIEHTITCDAGEIRAADRYVLPGVGAFDATMEHLQASGLVEVLNEEVLGHRKMVLGICVGMQILADSSEEGSLTGLGWLPGHVRLIDGSLLSAKPKLPHMGWNSITNSTAVGLFEGVDAAQGFYFLHSYYLDPSEASSTIATVNYGGEFPCAVRRNNVFGVQFHPEKSHDNGIAIFRNFAGRDICSDLE
jgi:imidazole glycerol-phosphate synthase subunit HisH